MIKTYTTIGGDMWDSISKKLYGSENYKDVLISANRQHRNLHILPAGLILDVPEIDTRKVSGASVPWRKVT